MKKIGKILKSLPQVDASPTVDVSFQSSSAVVDTSYEDRRSCGLTEILQPLPIETAQRESHVQFHPSIQRDLDTVDHGHSQEPHLLLQQPSKPVTDGTLQSCSFKPTTKLETAMLALLQDMNNKLENHQRF